MLWTVIRCMFELVAIISFRCVTRSCKSSHRAKGVWFTHTRPQTGWQSHLPVSQTSYDHKWKQADILFSSLSVHYERNMRRPQPNIVCVYHRNHNDTPNRWGCPWLNSEVELWWAHLAILMFRFSDHSHLKCIYCLNVLWCHKDYLQRSS